MEFSWNPNTKYTEKPQSPISTHPFSDVPSFSKIFKPIVRPNKLVNCVFATLVLQDYCQGYIFSYFFKRLRIKSFQNACWIFSDLCIPTCVGNIFQFMVFTFLENALSLCTFTHAPVPHSKLQLFENLFPTRQQKWRKLWFVLSKFNQKICR